MHRLFTAKVGGEQVSAAYCERCEIVVEPVPMLRGEVVHYMCPYMVGKSHRGKGITIRGKQYIAGTRLHWSAEVKRLAAFKCELMSLPGHECDGELTSHHMIRVAKRPRLELEIANGVCICQGPHGRLHEDPAFEKVIWRWFILNRTADADYILRFDKFADVAIEAETVEPPSDEIVGDDSVASE